MADLIIRGMEMPKSCADCPMFDESWCMALPMKRWREANHRPPKGERLPACPILPLQEEHGRLIDADALMAQLGETEYKGAIKRVLSQAPTIIPAEGGTE